MGLTAFLIRNRHTRSNGNNKWGCPTSIDLQSNVGRWSKSYLIHGWLTSHCNNAEFSDDEHFDVSIDELKELRDACIAVYNSFDLFDIGLIEGNNAKTSSPFKLPVVTDLKAMERVFNGTNWSNIHIRYANKRKRFVDYALDFFGNIDDELRNDYDHKSKDAVGWVIYDLIKTILMLTEVIESHEKFLTKNDSITTTIDGVEMVVEDEWFIYEASF